MTETTPADGRITTERLDRGLAVGIDRPRKLHGFSPKMLGEPAAAVTELRRAPLARVLAAGAAPPPPVHGFPPALLAEPAAASTALERDQDAWVGVLFAEGATFPAGLALAPVAPIMRGPGSVFPVGMVDP